MTALGVAAFAPVQENLAEEFAEIRMCRIAEIKTLEAEPSSLRSVRFQNAFGIETVHVIELPLGRVTQNVIRLGNSLETIFRMTITRIDVRVIPPRQPAECSLDFVDRRGSA